MTKQELIEKVLTIACFLGLLYFVYDTAYMLGRLHTLLEWGTCL